MPTNIASETIKIPKKYNSVERRAIASDIIDYIRKRTKKGKGINKERWGGAASKYTKEYKKSSDFKLKPDQSGKVNLTLTGDMLTAVETTSNRPGELKIGVPFNSGEWGKAKGNILGTYGKNTGKTSKARPFLNLSKEEVKGILSKYPLKKDEREKKLSKLKEMEKVVKKGVLSISE